MDSFLVRRPSPTLVVSVIALVVALGGTSYAAFTLPKNSVGTKQLKDEAVTGTKIKSRAITSTKIKNGAVTKAKLNLTGVVAPSALQANHANRADSAANADTLGGQPATAYLGSNALVHTGLVVLKPMFPPQPDAVLLRNGPLSLTANCGESLTDVTHTTATLSANSTEANWLASGIAQNSFSTVIATDTGDNGAQSGVSKTFDLETPSGAVLRGQVTIAENWPMGSGCAFNAYTVT
jgi:hypothetical protein